MVEVGRGEQNKNTLVVFAKKAHNEVSGAEVAPENEILESCLMIDDSLEAKGERSPRIVEPRTDRSKINAETGGKLKTNNRLYFTRKNVAQIQKFYIKISICSESSSLVKILFVREIFKVYHIWPFRANKLLKNGLGLNICTFSNSVFHRWKQKRV